jgi:UPF0755 protein
MGDTRRIGILVGTVLLLCGYLYLFAPPADFSDGSIVRIAHGTPLPEIAQELADAHIIAHPFVLRAVLRLTRKSNDIQTGVYKFENPQDLFGVAYRLVLGEYGLPAVRITFIEGVTIADAATQVAHAFGGISANDFLSAAQGQEGYLFPDTYFFQPGVDAPAIVAMLRANFNVKIAPLLPVITSSGHSLSDTVTMASILEKEARTPTDQRIVAGILWHRIQLGMPLQVDADRATYIHKGLPPVPLCNPGLASLEAATNPTNTTYLYYLTGTDGLMHYATTYAGHQANLKKYLP